ncbi:MAG: hypothetical protein KQJ78_01970 [Deltaproteobacteria bacterium]|nr:hypothetical protein [Deltaproteobacteria bacterium]
MERKVEFVIDHKYDAKNNRHFMNGRCTVLHCHHYATLITQLADDAEDFEGERLLKQAAEDTFYDVLGDYFEDFGIEELEDMIAVAEDYWKTVGMGLLKFTAVGKFAVVAEMEYSHLDEGWLKKWGSREEPVNFITAGFVAACSALFTDRTARAYVVRETKSLVKGDAVSEFRAILA